MAKKTVSSWLIAFLVLMELNYGQAITTKLEKCHLDICEIRDDINEKTDALQEEIREEKISLRQETRELIKDGRRALREELDELIREGRVTLRKEIRDLIREESKVPSDDLCSSEPCQNGGSCRITFNGYTCDCLPAFSGPTCSNEDECLSSPCHYGTCIDTSDGYECACRRAYTGTNCENMRPSNCADIIKANPSAPSGIYTILVDNSTYTHDAYCDMDTDGGGWLVFQKRFNGELKFDRDWNDYYNGFGNLSGEFWWGNWKVGVLTKETRYQLRIDLTDFDDNSVFIRYSYFALQHYPSYLRLWNWPGFSGDVPGDSLKSNVDQPFSTRDMNNDDPYHNCAERYRGGWWWKHCGASNLNGRYYQNATRKWTGMRWGTWKNSISLKSTEMKVRPYSF